MGLFRKPSLKKSVKARTVGKLKREAKKAVNPLYGKKGVGFAKNPKKAIKNKVYHATTVGVSDVVGGSSCKKPKGKKDEKKEKIDKIEKELNKLAKEIKADYENGKYNECVDKANRYIELADDNKIIVIGEVFDYCIFSCIDGGADVDVILSYYDTVIDYYAENNLSGWSEGFLESKNKFIQSLGE